MERERSVDHRIDYSKAVLLESEAADDPFALFGRWLRAAEEEGIPEPHAMTLATAGSFSISCRVVLLRSFDPQGFLFFTNYNSRKAMQLERDARAALTFHWPRLGRQVRIEGTASRVSAAESDAYFNSRPRGSRIGAWASDQSSTIADRAALDAKYSRWMDRFKEGEVPRPAHWGGSRVAPARIEFWQGRDDRMHDRILFTRMRSGDWSRARLQP